ncbi:MAG: metal-dependent transcriptional regulator [Peptostreptococcaceae bacterium]|nr:metal-dependent transcriptional regulator [Peptostreptococcaceae bacterium]
MGLHESGENYLETILILENETGFVRSVDIAERLNFSKPSVSRAMGILKADGYITVEQGGRIVLTDSGRREAERIYERHIILTKYLISIGVDEATAAKDACRMEHVISAETFDRMKHQMEICKMFH